MGDSRNDGLRKPESRPSTFRTRFTCRPGRSFWSTARSRHFPILKDVRAQVRTVDADQQVEFTCATWNMDHAPAGLGPGAHGRYAVWSFAILALLLAAVGLYSVVSYSVLQRTNEFGIRLALGAQRMDVVRLVFLSTALSVGGGLLAGLVLSLALNRVLAKWAENSVRDP